ncbi:MAG: hypothetical protein ACYSUD_12460, partial [Planctomycetota bacterium]
MLSTSDPEPFISPIADRAGTLGFVEHEDPSVTQIDVWTRWSVDLAEFASQGVNLSSVQKIILGVGNRANSVPGGSGTIYFDDIAVGNPIPPVGLVAHYTLENNAQDSSGNNHHGIVVGSPVYVDGPGGLGMALEFDGSGNQYVDLGTFDPSEVTGQLSISLWVKWSGLTSLYQGLIGKRDTWAADAMMWQIEANRDDGTLGFFR